MSYNTRFPSEHGTISADRESASLQQPRPRNGIGGQRSATLTYNSRPRVPDQKNVEIGVLTPMARIDGRMGTIRDNERCNDSVEEVDGIEVS